MARRGAVMPVALVAAAFLLSACGSSHGDRGLSDAGNRAAAGQAVGVATAPRLHEGAPLGAHADRLTAALTHDEPIDLDKPCCAQSHKHIPSPKHRPKQSPQ